MKGSNFRFFFTVMLVCVLFSSFVLAQKTKPVASKSSAPNKPTINKSTDAAKLVTTNKTSTVTVPTPANVSSTSATISFSVTEQAILDEINIARTEPQKYIAYLQEYRKLFNGNTYYPPNSTGIVTNEGTAAVDDAINVLRTLAKLSPYSMSKGLGQSANFQLKSLMEDSSIRHKSKDGGDLSSRLARFGSVGSIYSENITYFAKTPREVVITMLIDDGVKSRNHRKNILSPTFKQIGLGFGNGKNGEILCVAVFADSFKDGERGAMRQL